MERRDFLSLAAAAAGLVVAGAGGARAAAPRAPRKDPMHTRVIPSSGEALPAIGLGTWQAFDIDASEAERAPRRAVLEAFLAAGGRVIDSSPMYGRAESVVGELLAGLGKTSQAFLATKVWTTGAAEGEAQMRTSMKRLGTRRLDLMQVHNLLDVKAHLPRLRAWKEQGTFRYIGVTHYQLGAFAELERIVRKEKLDFVQLPYSIALRDAEKRLLPAAAASGTAVLVMRPFEGGELFAKVKGKPLPAWAAELDAASWGQLFLKFLLGHPAVTCPIPATSKVAHLVDNVGAGRGRLPDEAQRRKMVELVGSL